MVGRPALRHRLLEFAQPGSNGQPHVGKPAFPDIDVSDFLNGETQAGRAVFQDRSRDPVGRLTADYVVDDQAGADRLCSEGVPETELGNAALGGRSDLGHHEDEVRHITVRQIPEVGLKLMMHVIDEALGP
jgi:hypothetical protein